MNIGMKMMRLLRKLDIIVKICLRWPAVCSVASPTSTLHHKMELMAKSLTTSSNQKIVLVIAVILTISLCMTD